MSNKQVIIQSPTAESSAEMSAQINDTVKMTSYQVKRKLEAAKEQKLSCYNDLKKHIQEDIQPYLEEIDTRITAEAKEILIPQIVEKLQNISHWFEVGETGTYFDDNRTTEVSFELIAESILNIEKIDFSEEHAEVHFTIGIVGTVGWPNYHSNVETEEITFTPATLIKQFQLTDEEIGHRANLASRTKEMEEANKQYNDLDLQLKNLDNLSEDIEYALLKEKHSMTTTEELVNCLTDSLLNSPNISPDFLLSKK